VRARFRRGAALKRLWCLLAAAVLLSSCAAVPVVRRTPDSAPLGERPLTDGERGAYAAVSASAGADGAEALYYLGLDRAAAGDWSAAAGLWRQDETGHPASGWDRLAEFKLAQAFEKFGQGQLAFMQYQDLMRGPAVADLPERSRQSCLRLIATLDEQSLRARQAGQVEPDFMTAIRVRLLEAALAAGRVDEVRQGVDDYLRAYPLGPGLDEVEAISKKLEASVVVDSRAVGLLVPLTGGMAAFGAQVSQGVQLALDSANFGRVDADKIRLVVADEGGDTASAVAAADGLIQKDHVIGLLGPLSSDSAEALLPLLASNRTPMLCPAATRPDLANASPWFFRDTLSPEAQASAMADYAVVACRLTRVASLAPDDYYGSVSARSFAARIGALGGVVAVAVTYSPGSRDFRDAMLALGGIDPGLGKNADQDEMRDQQDKVDSASNAIGAVLKTRVQSVADAAGQTQASKVRLLVVDFAQDTNCAQLNAGRAFSDRFARTLSQLAGVDVIGPQAAMRYWTPLVPASVSGPAASPPGPPAGVSAAAPLSPAAGMAANALDLSLAAEAGRMAGADFVLIGSAASLPPDPLKWPDRGVFSLKAGLLDVSTTALCAQRAFTWTQYEAPAPNPLGLQAVYLPASAEDVVEAVPNMQFFDLNVPLLGSDQWDRPELSDHLAELNGSVFTAAYWGDSPDPAVARFDQAYRKAYAAKPDVLAAQAYDAAGLMAGAIFSGISDRASLRAALARVQGYDGASGHFGFFGSQDADKRPALVAVKNGALVLLKEP
jgi:ABC-type branched-subunit amino acid transport system substrate-binding protein